MSEQLEQAHNSHLRNHIAERIAHRMALVGVAAGFGGPALTPTHTADRLPSPTPNVRTIELPSQEVSGHSALTEAQPAAHAASSEAFPGAENAPIPRSMERAMRKNGRFVEVITNSGTSTCSGWSLKNNKGQEVAVATANHCFRAGLDNLVDGKNLMGTVKASSGTSSSEFHSTGYFDRIIVPDDKHTKTLDFAIAVKKGYSIKEALAVYNKDTLSRKQVKELLGKTGYVAGYPDAQPYNYTTDRHMQMLKVTFQHFDHTTTKEGETFDVLWASATPTSEGSFCSPTFSGAQGLVKTSTGEAIVGELSVMDDWSGTIPGSPNYDPANRVEPGKVAGLCGFSYKRPIEHQNTRVIHVVPDANGMPYPAS